MPTPTQDAKAAPFDRSDDCQHPLSQLRTQLPEQLRGRIAKSSFTCVKCGTTWNGADACLPVLHFSYQHEVLRLERMIHRIGGQPL